MFQHNEIKMNTPLCRRKERSHVSRAIRRFRQEGIRAAVLVNVLVHELYPDDLVADRA